VSSYFVDRIGRKKVFYISTIIHTVGVIIQSFTSTYYVLMIARGIIGICFGVQRMLTPLCKTPLYITLKKTIDQGEIAMSSNRGTLVSMYQSGISVGFSVGFGIAFVASDSMTMLEWRLMLLLPLIPNLLMLAGLWGIPESPRWLISQERYDEGLYILKELRDWKSSNSEVMMEFTSIVQDVSFDRLYTKKPFLTLFQGGICNYRKRTLLGAGVHILTQFTGINGVLIDLGNTALISKSVVGLFLRKETFMNKFFIGNSLIGGAHSLCIIPLLLFVDKIGRRVIFMAGAAVMGGALLLIAIMMACFVVTDVTNTDGGVVASSAYVSSTGATYAIMISIIVYFGTFTATWGPLGWVYNADIYPQLIRANAMGITTAFSYTFLIVITLLSNYLFNYSIWGTYLMFSISCFIMIWIIGKYYPETRVSHS
ncbi:general substrate transporter, partial [Spinellus fusiger]